jgi:hypothetical protein
VINDHDHDRRMPKLFFAPHFLLRNNMTKNGTAELLLLRTGHLVRGKERQDDLSLAHNTAELIGPPAITITIKYWIMVIAR